MKNIFATALILTFLLSACKPAPMPTPINLPATDSARPAVTLRHETGLYSGPGNATYPILLKLNPGDVLQPLGMYHDFIRVKTTDSKDGFAWKSALENLPAGLPELSLSDVPWRVVNASENFISDAIIFENGKILVSDIYNDGTNIEGGSIPLDGKFRIGMSLSLEDIGAGYANVQLIGTPHINHDEWWRELIRMDVGVNSRGMLQICIHNGQSAECVFDETLSIRDDKPFTLLFDDPQGRVFHVLDETGMEAFQMDVTSRTNINLPNGLFPDRKVWLGAWSGRQTTLRISSFVFEKAPTGEWNAAVGDMTRWPFTPLIEVEERFIEYQIPDNGPDALWGYGSSVITRQGEDVFVSMIETQSELKEPNNVYCVIHQRDDSGWRVRKVFNEPTREPCPIAGDGQNLYLSTNRSLGELSEPAIEKLDKTNFDNEPNVLFPDWEAGHNFTAWSYRGLGFDTANHELLALNISEYEGYYWSFLDENNQWSNKGVLNFPPDARTNESLRLAYPNVAIQNRAAYIMAVSDIIEPKEDLKTYMSENSGDFVYVFRQIHYAWTPDIATTPFSTWTVLTSVEPYGHVTNQDVWFAPDGTVHFLWLEQSVDYRLDGLLPEIPDTQTLWHATLKDGKILSRQPLVEYDTRGIRPEQARFHSLPDGRLFVIYSCYDTGYDIGNRFLEIYPDGSHSESVKLDLDEALEVFTIASQRNGSTESTFVDILGAPHWGEGRLNYVRIKIE